VNRYYDPLLHREAIKILPGEYAVAGGERVIVTVLGSCVSACMWDERLGIGGMNHFMLPASRFDSGASARYGINAMELLVNALIKKGSQRSDLSVKVFGGAAVLGAVTIDVGRSNGAFVRKFLRDEGLRLVAEDLFGTLPRKVYQFADSGAVKVKYLRTLANDTVVRREREYAARITEQTAPFVEMFE
jgi:chemotaxis protein CheD